MAEKIRLSELVEQIQDAIQERFAGQVFWITSEITDVKPRDATRSYRFLKFIEKEGNITKASIDAVFWSNSIKEIDKFERLTKQEFTSGLEITCKVLVRFNNRYGIKLEVLEIDCTYSLGKIELEKQQTLEKLLKENSRYIQLVEGQYRTVNNSLPLPTVIQNIALVTAPNSDGQRDFKQEIEKNKYGYRFLIKEFLTQVQGDNAHRFILQKLDLIKQEKEKYDVVVIIRGGGSQLDFKPFDDYELSKQVAVFPIPILTGIGHDRNTSIVDLMAYQLKTPTKVATFITDHNMNFESSVEDLKERFFQAVAQLIEDSKGDLQEMKRVLISSSPSTILKKGFAMIMQNGKIVTNPEGIKMNSQIETILKKEIIHSTITKKTKNENKLDI